MVDVGRKGILEVSSGVWSLKRGGREGGISRCRGRGEEPVPNVGLESAFQNSGSRWTPRTIVGRP